MRGVDARRLMKDGRYARPRLAYRDVASATNQLTLIAAVIPANCISTHTVFCLRTPLARPDQHLLCALFNSFVMNYLARLRVSTHVTTAIVEQLPVPTRASAPRVCGELAALSRSLSRRPEPAVSARMQALVAGLYQLSVEEFEYVLSTFPLVSEVEREQALTIYRNEGQATAKSRTPGR